MLCFLAHRRANNHAHSRTPPRNHTSKKVKNMEQNNNSNIQSFSVSSALSLAKDALESINITILGEVSEVNQKVGYKAVYFTIKDDNSSLPCMIWVSRYSKLGINLKVGALVSVTGRFSLYAKKGRMSFDAFNIKYAGEGELRMRVAQLAKKLESQGLMDAEKKRELPPYPEMIGVVTSPRGAAVHDVLRTLRRRYPLAHVLLAGVPVEGSGAASGMSDAILEVAREGSQVILLVRGGGSFEDLMPFNEECLARTISTCPVPVVTGIGHETDNSIADMVADFRASTPTAAAEAVSPDIQVLKQNVNAQARRMHNQFNTRLQQSRFLLNGYATSSVLRDPNVLLSNWSLEIDDAYRALTETFSEFLPKRELALRQLSQKLSYSLPKTIDRQTQNLQLLEQKMATLLSHATRDAESLFSSSTSALNALSPLATLSRGYSIVRDSGGGVLKDATRVCEGDNINITLENAELDAQVTNVKNVRYFALDNKDS